MNQRGFTLIEILVALAVGGIIMPIIVSTIFGVVQGTVRNNGMAVALSDIDRVSHWLTRDVVLAQGIDLLDGAPPVSQVTLTWIDLTSWAAAEGPISHAVTYTLSGTKLLRDYDGQVTTVGKYLTLVEFSINGNLLTVTLTSSPDGYIPRPSETRSYRIYLRTKLGL